MKKCKYCNETGKEFDVFHYPQPIKVNCKKCHGKGVR